MNLFSKDLATYFGSQVEREKKARGCLCGRGGVLPMPTTCAVSHRLWRFGLDAAPRIANNDFCQIMTYCVIDDEWWMTDEKWLMLTSWNIFCTVDILLDCIHIWLTVDGRFKERCHCSLAWRFWHTAEQKCSPRLILKYMLDTSTRISLLTLCKPNWMATRFLRI